jgi:glyoxylate utilization-related uncharacterized protein
MRATLLSLFLIAVAIVVLAQAPPSAAPQTALGPGPSTGRGTMINQADPGWHKSSVDPTSENMALHEDPVSGALDVFARYPAGFVFPPHWHMANERLLLVEGKLQIDLGGKIKALDPGGFAFLPAREVQRISCVSKTRCVVYMSWDGKYDNHKAQ